MTSRCPDCSSRTIGSRDVPILLHIVCCDMFAVNEQGSRSTLVTEMGTKKVCRSLQCNVAFCVWPCVLAKYLHAIAYSTCNGLGSIEVGWNCNPSWIWIIEKWKKVILSDVSCFPMYYVNGRMWILRFPTVIIKLRCIVGQTQAYGGITE